jgi:release factor glutamine methyltransferase
MKSSRKHVIYDDLSFTVFDEVYEPAEDTFIAADALKQIVRDGDTVLDVGTGCGILAVVAAKRTDRVVAIDVNPYAVECAKLNAEANNVADKINIRLGSMFHPLSKAERFDLILFNAPYLPSSSEEEKTWLTRAWAGGPKGRKLIDQFIAKSPRYLSPEGKILLVQSSLADIDETLAKFRERGLDTKIIVEKKVPFEKIVVIQASNLSRKSV